MAGTVKNSSEANSERDSGRALRSAAEQGNEELVSQLLEDGADINAASAGGWTSLHRASLNGKEKVASLLLKLGANIEAADNDGWTPLHFAAFHGHINLVFLLINQGANIEAANKTGWTPLFFAARNGHSGVASRLLERGANVEAADKDRWTPLHWAASEGHKEVASLLVKRRANIEAAGTDGRTPLLCAAVRNQKDAAYVLLERGANIEAAVNYVDALLHDAALKGHKEAVSLLVARGANIEATDRKYGCPPLILAAAHDHKDVVSLLLESGANVEATDKFGRTPLLCAAVNGRKEVACILLKHGANIEAAVNYVATLLHDVVLNRPKEALSLLVPRGAGAEASRKDGWTPLHWAADKGDKDLVSLLLDFGANVEAADVRGRTPLHGAARNGHKELVSLLLERGANIEAADVRGRTPLHHVARAGHKEVVSLLLERGANFEAASNLGWTPLVRAAAHGHDEVVALLLEHGASIEAADKEGETVLQYVVSYGSDSVLSASLEKLSRSLSAEDVIRSNSRAVVPLLAKDRGGETLIDVLQRRLAKSTEIAATSGIFGDPALRVLLERVPFPSARVHLCGPGGAGKTLLRYQLQGDRKGIRELKSKNVLDTRTRSVNISPATLDDGFMTSMVRGNRRQLVLQIFDQGGQHEFQVTYYKLLGQALCIFIIVIPVCPDGIRNPNGDEWVLEPTNETTTEKELKHWLSMLSTQAHPIANQAIVAVNVFDGVEQETIDRHVGAVRKVLIEYSQPSRTGEAEFSTPPQSGDVEDHGRDEGEGKLTRLNLVSLEPIVLNCMSSNAWKKSTKQSGCLFDHMCTAWDNLQSLEEDRGVELSMPKLCSDLMAKIPDLRAGRPPVDTAASARQTVKDIAGGLFKDLSDEAIDALLGYAEKCGEVLLHYQGAEEVNGKEQDPTGQLKDVVIWNPDWFFSSVLGEFFRPLGWNPDAREVRMTPNDVKQLLLRGPMGRILFPLDDIERERILDSLLGLMKDMQLCAIVRTAEVSETWFPLFLNSPDRRICLSSDSTVGVEVQEIYQDKLSAKDILYDHFESTLEEDAWKNDCCRLRGRFLSIRDLWPDRSTGDKSIGKIVDWRMILPGSFERFMARVLQAFPGRKEGNQAKLFMTPNLIQVTWQSDSQQTQRAHIQCQMLYEHGKKVAWIAWVWASDDEAASHLLEIETSAEKDCTLQVIDQLSEWMQEASTDERMTFRWHIYPLLDDAFSKSGAEVLFAGHRYLAPREKPFPSSDQQGDLQRVVRFTKASFKLLKQVSEGAYGTVWRAHEVGTSGPEYAIKEMKTKDMSPRQQRAIHAAFETEVGNLRRARHEHVVPLVDYVTYGEASAPRIAIMTEFAPLGSLEDVICAVEDMSLELHPADMEWEPLQHLLTPDVRCSLLFKVLKDVASGLEHLHSVDIIHRDLKPPNVLLFPPLTAKLCDFGTSKHVLHGTSVEHTEGVGTCRYMAPEVRNGRYSYAADCWSFGIVLHEAFHRLSMPLGSAGASRYERVPHHTCSLPESRRSLEDVRNVCLQEKPAERYDTRGSGPNLADALAAFDPFSGDENAVLERLSELLQAYNRVDLCLGGSD